jgi:hypothetical protein
MGDSDEDAAFCERREKARYETRMESLESMMSPKQYKIYKALNMKNELVHQIGNYSGDDFMITIEGYTEIRDNTRLKIYELEASDHVDDDKFNALLNSLSELERDLTITIGQMKVVQDVIGDMVYYRSNGEVFTIGVHPINHVSSIPADNPNEEATEGVPTVDFMKDYDIELVYNKIEDDWNIDMEKVEQNLLESIKATGNDDDIEYALNVLSGPIYVQQNDLTINGTHLDSWVERGETRTIKATASIIRVDVA